ncbi:hypothetical protein ACHAWT_007197 [Skeletonema menzelii]|mmetsp:Transcript_9846/g.16291  ORF Transcript_9846/g.16291 Transcript_9846/m.16291 type:complete len:534 (-) Transcript_9846:97-1698(-)
MDDINNSQTDILTTLNNNQVTFEINIMATESPPLTGVTKITENDIICGRGGVALRHPGNLAYRKIVGLNKGIYATCLKAEKLKISKSIVAAIREIDGRFLEREDGKMSSSLDEKDERGNPVTWKDIGDKRAIEKTSQALREGQPKLLKKLAAMGQIAQAPLPQSTQTTQPLQQQMQMHSSWSGQPSPGDARPETMTRNITEPAYMGTRQTYAPPPDLNNSGNSGFQPGASLRLSDLSRLSVVGNGLEGAMEGETFDAFPRNSIVERGALAGSAQSWHDSWGETNPAPLPYNMNPPDNNVFSAANQQHLLNCLEVDNGGGISAYSGGASGDASQEKKRPSVKFQIEGRPSILHAKNISYFGDTASLTSHLDEMSIFDTHSLDSGLDAADREMEMELLGEFETMDHSLNLAPSWTDAQSSGGGNQQKSRRSILRHQSRYSQRFSPAAAVTQGVDPGLIFTSTFDTKPGGINSGTDVSGLLGERRKSAVAFEVNVERRRSSRMSIMSMFSRDAGSGYLSIQSADIRDLLEMDSDSD